uniref:Uncharacterized protein n=1 Tax=Amphimedon queenslandica TaxID=400682 RepID=A0A1X7SU08_AMPQE
MYLNELVKELEHTMRVDAREQLFCQTYLSYADMLKRVDPLHEELKDLETKAEDTRPKGEEITKIIAELEASIAKYKEEYAMLISDANVIKNNLSTVEKKVDRRKALLTSLSGERENVLEHRE